DLHSGLSFTPLSQCFIGFTQWFIFHTIISVFYRIYTVLDNLFSAQLRSLILNQPDITSEGSTSGPSHSNYHPSQGLAGRGMGAGPVVPRLFLDFLRQQRMFRGRSRKSATARGCFGMKVDRIGSISGLGC
uniref:Natriuretic peptide C n=1 Tax=Hucho hucho TaxID=62062 RepID=A0A4W5KRQ9_9TELE